MKKITSFSDFLKLKNELKSLLREGFEKTVFPQVQERMLFHIDKEVYKVYSPKYYIRRYDERGGLKTRENIVKEFFLNTKDSDVRMEVTNITKKNNKYKNEYLTPLIEFGHEVAEEKGYFGYRKPKVPYMNPREFVKKTREELKESKYHLKGIEMTLRKNNIKTIRD